MFLPVVDGSYININRITTLKSRKANKEEYHRHDGYVTIGYTTEESVVQIALSLAEAVSSCSPTIPSDYDFKLLEYWFDDLNKEVYFCDPETIIGWRTVLDDVEGCHTPITIHSTLPTHYAVMKPSGKVYEPWDGEYDSIGKWKEAKIKEYKSTNE